jgi:hypothetical protein
VIHRGISVAHNEGHAGAAAWGHGKPDDEKLRVVLPGHGDSKPRVCTGCATSMYEEERMYAIV